MLYSFNINDWLTSSKSFNINSIRIWGWTGVILTLWQVQRVIFLGELAFHKLWRDIFNTFQHIQCSQNCMNFQLKYKFIIEWYSYSIVIVIIQIKFILIAFYTYDWKLQSILPVGIQETNRKTLNVPNNIILKQYFLNNWLLFIIIT